MKVAIFSESPADEAAIRVFINAVLNVTTDEIGWPSLQGRGWPGVKANGVKLSGEGGRREKNGTDGKNGKHGKTVRLFPFVPFFPFVPLSLFS